MVEKMRETDNILKTFQHQKLGYLRYICVEPFKLRQVSTFRLKLQTKHTHGYSHLSGMDMTSRLKRCFQSRLRLRDEGGGG